MAGRGPAPKPQGRRANRNGNHAPTTIIEFEPAEPPELPELGGGLEWCQRTREWWDMWCNHPISKLFTASDWEFLMDTALIHQDYWGFMNLAQAPELRNRVGKFGATPEDRARLRIQFADADERDSRRPKPEPQGSARERRRQIKVVGDD